jgi:hypothetical protein
VLGKENDELKLDNKRYRANIEKSKDDKEITKFQVIIEKKNYLTLTSLIVFINLIEIVGCK